MISAYSPTDVGSESSKDHFYHQLDKAIKASKKNRPSFKILIGSDMNATIGTDSYGVWKCLGRNIDDRLTNGNGQRLLTVCENNNLYIVNSIFDRKPIHRTSWYMKTGFKKRTDYIIAEKYIKKVSTQCQVYRKASKPFASDHRMIVLSCNLPTKAARREATR